MSRTLPHFIQTILTPQTSLKVIDLLERILFPLDGYPAPTPPDPTPEEVMVMREKLDKRMDEMVPGKSALRDGMKLIERYFYTSPASRWSVISFGLFVIDGV